MTFILYLAITIILIFFNRTSMRDHDDYRARKIAEFREKTRV